MSNMRIAILPGDGIGPENHGGHSAGHRSHRFSGRLYFRRRTGCPRKRLPPMPKRDDRRSQEIGVAQPESTPVRDRTRQRQRRVFVRRWTSLPTCARPRRSQESRVPIRTRKSTHYRGRENTEGCTWFEYQPHSRTSRRRSRSSRPNCKRLFQYTFHGGAGRSKASHPVHKANIMQN